MYPGESGAILRAMIGGEAEMDLALMRRTAAGLCAGRVEDDPATALCARLVEAIELLDLAVIHHVPRSLVERMREEARELLRTLESDFPGLAGQPRRS